MRLSGIAFAVGRHRINIDSAIKLFCLATTAFVTWHLAPGCLARSFPA
jgi:hypothetical protein